jgi:drug/metabolite transporter (DMT)-like permease
MKPRDLAELLLLAALWGASFLFLRMGAGEFGPATLAGLRVAGAALVLLPLLYWNAAGLAALRSHWRPIAVVGLTNSALPFLAFGYAVLTIPAGLASIFNAAAPLFGAAIAWGWLGERPGPIRLLGLAIGFAGVAGLAVAKARHGVSGAGDAAALATGLAIAACIAATVSYGFAANYTRRRLAGVPPLAVAAGSQATAALWLAVPMLWWWPAQVPSPTAWGALALLAVVCTGFAYLLYFRLIAHVGAGNAIAVTFLIPGFAVGWGALVLGERITTEMVIGCAVILAGTALATGLVGSDLRRARA